MDHQCLIKCTALRSRFNDGSIRTSPQSTASSSLPTRSPFGHHHWHRQPHQEQRRSPESIV
uniref:Uncharacterized protein n=1 Tax=Daphnia galeata TaxID=27404 RepID=A0A8J2WHD3_9CRUS|nr:unnamed protein product [Daphnia galeata]